jgi:large subunit ribosomal protein L25
MQLQAKKRETLGKKNKYIRRGGEIPAVVFGKGMESVNLTVDYNTFDKAFKQAGETDLIDIVTEKEKYKVLVKDVQYNPVTSRISHASFYKPDLTIKTEAQVPVEIIGEEDNELIKSGAALALQLIQEVTVEALPEDIPHSFTIDVSDLTEIGQGFSISQLDYDREKVSIPDIDPEEMVVRIDEIVVQEEEPEVAPVSEEEAIAGLEATAEKPATEEEEKAEEKEKK